MILLTRKYKLITKSDANVFIGDQFLNNLEIKEITVMKIRKYRSE